VGRDCGNGGVFPGGARLPRLSSPQPQQRNAVWGTWAVLPEYLSILQRSDCREAGAIGGTQMKTINIRLPDVEAAMLLEVQKVNRAYRDL